VKIAWIYDNTTQIVCGVGTAVKRGTGVTNVLIRLLNQIQIANRCDVETAVNLGTPSRYVQTQQMLIVSVK
jgi:hypothetical protein